MKKKKPSLVAFEVCNAKEISKEDLKTIKEYVNSLIKKGHAITTLKRR